MKTTLTMIVAASLITGLAMADETENSFTNGLSSQIDTVLPHGWSIAYTDCTRAGVRRHFGEMPHYFIALIGGYRRLYINRQFDALIIAIPKDHAVDERDMARHKAVLVGTNSLQIVLLQKPKDMSRWPTMVEDLRSAIKEMGASNITPEDIRR